eukprot:1303613-Alexandrium_andersonii.AAC.1
MPWGSRSSSARARNRAAHAAHGNAPVTAIPHHLERLPLPGEAVTIWARIEDCQMCSHSARMPA